MFAPRWIAVVDVDALPEELVAPRLEGEPACRYLGVRVLVRLHGAPLGLIECPLVDGVLTGSQLRAAITRELGDAEAAHLARCAAADSCPSWGPEPEHWPFVSVVVCTHERPDSLADCLASLAAVDYPTLEIVIVDNAPRTTRTRELVEGWPDARLRYVCAEIPGLSAARNYGVERARGEIVAFTDDDVKVDPNWVRGLVRGFGRREDVGLVTGLVLAAELESPSQGLFERKVTWGAALLPRLFAVGSSVPAVTMTPFNCGMVGAGASFAARRSTLIEIGPFDEALGAGTPSRGGEDLDYFRRVLVGGRAIAFEPASLVWHYHRRDMESLRRQMLGYGSGLTAFAFKQLLVAQTRGEALRDVPSALGRLTSEGTNSAAEGRLDDVGDLPRELLVRELVGMGQGPILYLRGRKAMRRLRAGADRAR
jgi:GT2 family glycosyltransferase